MKKFVHRNMTAVIAGAVVLVTLVAGSIVSTTMAIRALRAERVEQQRFEELRSVALTFMFDIDQKLGPVPGNLPARISLLQAAGRYLDQLSQHARVGSDDQELLTQLGQAYSRLAATLHSIGDKSRAAEAHDKALAIFRALHEAHPQELKYLLSFAEALGARSSTLRDLGQTDHQADLLRGGIALLESALDDSGIKTDPQKGAQIHRQLVTMYAGLADSLRISGRYADALLAAQQSLANCDALPAENQADPAARADKSVALQKIGDLYEIQNDLDKAFASHQAALQLLLANQPAQNSAPLDGVLARNYARLGHVAWRQGRLDIAVENHRKQYEIRKRLSEAEPASTMLKRDLGRAMRQLGLATAPADPREATRLLDDSITLLESITREKPDDLTNLQELGESLVARGRIQSPGDPARRIANLQRSIDVNNQVLTINPGDATSRTQIHDAEGIINAIKSHPATTQSATTP
jgi:tetratricopeptide (TPR) repeat protein